MRSLVIGLLVLSVASIASANSCPSWVSEKSCSEFKFDHPGAYEDSGDNWRNVAYLDAPNLVKKGDFTAGVGLEKNVNESIGKDWEFRFGGTYHATWLNLDN